ncbi:DNA polymerase III subunit gamma/tau [Thermostichus vulcanus]|uniref:DNA polymerase III subunit gamma/tau n=1 Tax=Thermostichus vulcanus str. 'Rupite' TaxID=2813851 RepID=A0ABT0CFP5_THEVL|nr:DNA polymerase III subunit gamma/tau [Thermostichus vulcanus]MCJ2544195.1 DNA polymerase III subunit gamma/tau [Thermostichus vulcanus str. 'Rupite']
MAESNAYEPLHLKYRPQRFADVVGQAAVVQTLANAIRLGRIAPAYLFCGPRGTGKTSSARILAKSLNCERGPTADPCQVCSQCRAITGGSSLDVIEIDAASNTGVDNIRELIERAQFAPVSSRYKVYVIDECHMLSNAAFNALLKTLEEPPAHVVFVLATTDPQRVLPTVISRCQRFDYRRIPLRDMVDHLAKIATQEGIPITPEALQLVAQLSQGGLRDAESLLDQLSLLEGTITPETVWDLVGAIPERHLLDLIDALAAQNAQGVLTQARQLLEHGKEPLVLVQNLVGFYRDLLLIKTAPEQRELVALTDSTWEALRERAPNYSVEILLAAQSHLRQCEPQIRQSGQPRLWLEIALMDLLRLWYPDGVGQLNLRNIETAPATVGLPLPKTEPIPAPIATAPIVKESVSVPPVATTPLPQPPSTQRDPVPTATASPEPKPPKLPESPVNLLRPRWDEFLKRLSPVTKALMVSGHLHQETPEEITLAFPSKGLAEKVRGKESELRSVLQSLLQRSVRLNLIVQRSGEAVHTTSSRDTAPASPTQGSPPRTPSPEKPEPMDPPSERPSPLQSLSKSDPSPTPGRAALTKIDELEEVARRFAEHFNGSLVDLEGVLGSPDLQTLEAVEAEGSPTEFPEEVAEPPLAPAVPLSSRVRTPPAEEEEDLPF